MKLQVFSDLGVNGDRWEEGNMQNGKGELALVFRVARSSSETAPT